MIDALGHTTIPAIFDIYNSDQMKPRLPRLGPQKYMYWLLFKPSFIASK